jgi:uncharacterized protein (DUF952 family)
MKQMQKYFEPIFHITTEKEWKNCVEDIYYPDDFSSEGFIHFSTRKQLVNTANRIFSKGNLLFVLEVEQEVLKGKLFIFDFPPSPICSQSNAHSFFEL